MMRKVGNKYLIAATLAFTLFILTWVFALWFTSA